MIMPKSIEIVTHCYSSDTVPIYHNLLHLQLSSIVRNAHLNSELFTYVSVCYSSDDPYTTWVVDYFKRVIAPVDNVMLLATRMSKGSLFRRAIGRNLCAEASRAEVVWFTDCDHIFEQDCLTQAYQQCVSSTADLVYPKVLQIHQKHSYGDRLIKRVQRNQQQLSEVNTDEFKRHKNTRAIGGIQIVKGDYCRANGYLKDTKWQDSVDPSKGFQQCRCDIPFRKACTVKSAPVDHLYRVRHSKCGRDGGTKDHGAKTK